VLQTYTDGRVDRWIEVPSAANAKPEFPAPVVTLAAPPGGSPASSAPASKASVDPVDPTTPPVALGARRRGGPARGGRHRRPAGPPPPGLIARGHEARRVITEIWGGAPTRTGGPQNPAPFVT
jgi:hypothetical protein